MHAKKNYSNSCIEYKYSMHAFINIYTAQYNIHAAYAYIFARQHMQISYYIHYTSI